MKPLLGLVTQVAHLALMLGVAPGLVGLIRALRARQLGRAGAPILQPYRDLMRLVRKQPVLAEGASVLFRAAPVVCCVAVALAAALVPSFTLGMIAAPMADLVAITGLLALSRVVLVLAAMDAGTAFGGMGASRVMAWASLAAPALFLVIFTLALAAGTTNVDGVAVWMRDSVPRLSLGFALVAVVLVAIAETGRMPFDAPASQPELAMARQALTLEYSGRHLALVEFASALVLLVWFSLIAAIWVPYGIAPAGSGPLGWGVGLLAWVGKIAVLALALAVFEVATVNARIWAVPRFLGLAALLGLIATVFLFVVEGVS